MLRKLTSALMIGLAAPAMARGRAALRHRYFRDRSRRPSQDDFWQFANGRWLAASSIPADRAA